MRLLYLSSYKLTGPTLKLSGLNLAVQCVKFEPCPSVRYQDFLGVIPFCREQIIAQRGSEHEVRWNVSYKAFLQICTDCCWCFFRRAAAGLEPQTNNIQHSIIVSIDTIYMLDLFAVCCPRFPSPFWACLWTFRFKSCKQNIKKIQSPEALSLKVNILNCVNIK